MVEHTTENRGVAGSIPALAIHPDYIRAIRKYPGEMSRENVEGLPGARASAPKRVAFAAVLTIVGLNVWTGGPLLALWVGSRVQGSGPPTMGAVFVVVIVLGAVSFALAVLFSRLTQKYQEMTGQRATVRNHTPWLRSMRGERPQYQGVEPTLTTPERILVAMVVVAFVLFEIWFFFFSASPIDNRTGRTAVPPPIVAAR